MSSGLSALSSLLLICTVFKVGKCMRHHLTHLRATDLLMAFLSVISVLLVTARWWGHETLTSQTLQLFYDLDSLICYFFLAHFAYGLARAPDRKAYFKANWFYLPGSLPMVESLRWARLIQLWRVYQLLRSQPDLLAMFRRERNETTISGILFLFVLLLGLGSGIMYWIESGQPGSEIETPYDAFWWTLVTLSTVGYGDLVPKTEEGRFVASLLILFGVGLFGALSGFMASLFLQPNRGDNDTEKWRHHYNAQQEQLLQELRALRAEVRELRNK
ncbi:two pore domain potassium channel family protein [Aeromonas enteropelogenes]|uniref:Ion transporter n=2 Tax=Aeromonas TaxID=642 RepID=A0A175VEV2_AEREN|nr:potassium channel family protein [Aeromonas enteropelogenes]KXU79029.1 ion transporter [Aeromonas enteropelogenes]MBL0458836.1 two pore domain potassium channel family protein [Aeromonas enteropelogenes]MBL0459527.1 two pore domain potassium channel family protein [Aeromonas enteropelogenes]MBL0522446.1 two pore domain potassium channel family protein [Aeromonas enteropelogenes]UAK73112.1 potassium channel family protein [Aeromonas enteropelogenes]